MYFRFLFKIRDTMKRTNIIPKATIFNKLGNSEKYSIYPFKKNIVNDIAERLLRNKFTFSTFQYSAT